MTNIRCVVERITYQNPENGYSVLKVRVKGYQDLVTLVGNLLDVNVGSVLLARGDWKIDSRYGRQFVALSWEETLPATVYGMEKYLGSGLIKGVGPKFAQRIVAKFGSDTFTVIEDEVERLLEVEGIGQKRIRMIAASWEKQKEIKNIMLFLQQHEVSTSFAAKIYKTYGNESLPIVKENPFRLADDIWGIGFKTADGIAAKLGFQKEDAARCRSGLAYTLNELANSGHVYARREQLVESAVRLLEVREEAITKTLDGMLEKQELLCEGEAIYLPPFGYAEMGVAAKLKKLAKASGMLRKENKIDIKKIEGRTGFHYDETQALAIQTAISSKVMVLTGGPGTGKTTTTQGILEALKFYGCQVLLAAPTGRAAKRMAEATGMEAKTIHRLLEYKPPEGYQRNEKKVLEGDVLIVDEASMIDVLLMNSLLRAVPPQMSLILVGDIDQLPSVGAGNVLRDIIDSACFPVICLTKIFRQAQSSRIIMNAHRINRGEFPDCRNGAKSDFFFVEREEAEEAAAEIVDLVKRKLPSYYQVEASSIQVLTPMQRGVVGASQLNLALQEALNPRELALRHGGYAYREGDKVMQIKNNYDKEIFNGDIGRVETVQMEQRSLTVLFESGGVEKRVEYEQADLDELTLAYAVTVHKSQGSEYPVVVMPVLMTHYVMLQRNLIYTGITRAKKILVLVGSKKALSYAVRNVTVSRRNTLLKERLAEESL
ncbi:MAG: ATP-dependent RecD-like DNA helicase [bacterium]|nr:ATP-dependent RecD-like DNA helicase [bacterium]